MVQQIDPTEVKAKLDAGEPVFLLDVRQPEEFAICRIAGGVLIPLGELAARVSEVNPSAGATVVVYCHHGMRSQHGALVLAQAGMENVVSMAGGIEAWSVLIDPTVPRY